jgi:hypothetical protein
MQLGASQSATVGTTSLSNAIGVAELPAQAPQLSRHHPNFASPIEQLRARHRGQLGGPVELVEPPPKATARMVRRQPAIQLP